MKKWKRYIIPVLGASVVVLVIGIAIMFAVRNSEGYYPDFQEIFLSRPICYFWLLWFALAFYSINGIVKEYRRYKDFYATEYPLVSQNVISRSALIQITYTYSKKLLLVLLGLPFAAYIINDNGNQGLSLQGILFSLIPFFIDLIIYLYTRQLLTPKKN